jgi:hypothetical protein
MLDHVGARGSLPRVKMLDHPEPHVAHDGVIYHNRSTGDASANPSSAFKASAATITPFFVRYFTPSGWPQPCLKFRLSPSGGFGLAEELQNYYKRPGR